MGDVYKKIFVDTIGDFTSRGWDFYVPVAAAIALVILFILLYNGRYPRATIFVTGIVFSLAVIGFTATAVKHAPAGPPVTLFGYCVFDCTGADTDKNPGE